MINEEEHMSLEAPMSSSTHHPLSISCLPADLLALVLSYLSSTDLATCNRVGKLFRLKERRHAAMSAKAGPLLTIVEKVARDKLVIMHGSLELATRWR